jgi:hypothetical protein
MNIFSVLPTADHCLLDHSIRPLKHADWNCQTNLFCCLKVNDEFKLRRLLHRQVSRFGAFQNLVHVNSRAPIEVIVVRPVEHEAALIDKLLLEVGNRYLTASSTIRFPSAKKRLAAVVIIASTCFCFAV